MGRFLGGVLSNDSAFGRAMGRCWIIIGSNLMFVIFCLPVVTAGPALAALFYVMLKHLRNDSVTSPFKTFFEGFKMNFKQGLICWLLFLALCAFLGGDVYICRRAGGGMMSIFLYVCGAMLAALLILAAYMAPVMATFADTIPHLVRNAVFFAARRPWKIIPIAALWVIPVGVTVLDERMRPLYGFLWVVCGFGLIAMGISAILLPDFEKYLPSSGDDEEGPGEVRRISERQTRREMKRLDK